MESRTLQPSPSSSYSLRQQIYSKQLKAADSSLSLSESFDYFDKETHPNLTPSAAIRDRYYQSHRYLSQEKLANIDSGIDEEENEDTLYDEKDFKEDMLDYRPGQTQCYPKPIAPSIYSISDAGSTISLRTEYNDSDARSINSIRTVDDRLQGQRTLGNNLNSFVNTAKRVSRSGTLFRSKNAAPKIKLEASSSSEKRMVPGVFMPQRENRVTRDNASIRTAGGTSLLSKLSKSTMSVKTKLSAFSTFTKNPRLDPHSNTKKRVAESVYNMPIASISTSSKLNSGARRDSFAHTHKHTPSNNAAEIPVIMGASLVDEPVDLPTQQKEAPVQAPPSVYPALLSKVAQVFKDRIVVTIRTKDSIKYKDVFDGKEAVDKLAFIIKTTDRNLALLLGRALDAQRFFHDVNYEHRLRDSNEELYQFKEHVRPVSGLFLENPKINSVSEFNLKIESNHEQEGLPNGVFTLLTDCYSATCTSEKLCYSVFCPRRQEQAKRLERGHSRENSTLDLISQEDRLWINTVPKSLLDTLSMQEIKRQENIFELIYTEKDFVNDLNYIKEQWINPLLDPEITMVTEKCVQDIFWNISEVEKVNSDLCDALSKRQSKNKIVANIGDIMLAHVANFEPFVRYGAHQIIGKYVFETEKTSNPAFDLFVKGVERLPVSRKLELNGYLTKPTTRLGRYNLLLREILKHTPKKHPDQETIPRVMSIIARFLADVNRETGKTENKFNLELLDQRLTNKNISNVDLDLLAPNRKIVIKGTWNKGSGSESSDVLVYLLDHCLLIIKSKVTQNEERYKLYRKPIPLALLSISFLDQTKRASTIIPLGRPSNVSTITNANQATDHYSHKSGYPVSFVHLGKESTGPITLYANTMASRKQWTEKIEEQRKALVEKFKVFNIQSINESFFSTFNKVNCIAVFENGRSMILGGDQGVYLKKEGSRDELIRILAMDKVSQVDILSSSNLILVLADKVLYAYSLDTLLSTETGMKRGRKISSHVSYFKVGTIKEKTQSNPEGLEKTLVCFVRYNAMTSTIRALESCEAAEKKNKHNLGRLIRGNNDVLKSYKALYIPGEASSIQFFKNIICVGSARGFQMVNLSSAEVQSVLDPSDESNNLLLEQHENMKPISMFRHKDGNILLCYSEIAFYIDKKGKRVKNDWSISWDGNPTAFAFRFPYVVAFNSNFIEIRHMDTGDLLQVIPGNNIRCLRPDSTDIIHGVMDDRLAGSEVVFELKLVDPHRRKKSMIKNRPKAIMMSSLS